MSYKTIYHRINPPGLNQTERFDLDKYTASADGEIGYHFPSGWLTRAEVEDLANVIYDDLGLGWLPYPENVPEHSWEYTVTYHYKDTEGDHYFEGIDIWAMTEKSGFWLYEDDFEVVAYRKSNPYQPKEAE